MEAEPPLIMDEEDAARENEAAAYREAAQKYLDYLRGLIATMITYRGNKSLLLACVAVAHGEWDLLPDKDFMSIARRYQCTKANVVKLVKHIQNNNLLPPTLNQRSREGCRAMRRARKAQLKMNTR